MALCVVCLIHLKNLGVRRLFHVRRDRRSRQVFQGLAAPIGEDLFAQITDVAQIDVKWVLGPLR